MFIIVAGAGKVGYHLARALVADHEVLLIELDPARVDFVAEELGSDVIMQGDACDAATMERAGMERADLVVAVTGDDDDNLTFCQIAKARFSVPRAVARINNPQNEALFRQLGIDSTVSATNLILGHIEQELPWRGLIPLMTLTGRGLEIVEVRVPREALRSSASRYASCSCLRGRCSAWSSIRRARRACQRRTRRFTRTTSSSPSPTSRPKRRCATP